MSSLARRVAIYARVSSQRQQKQSTIQSQLTQLRCRVEQDRHQLLDEHVLLDDGYSGSYLDRPALDRLRDLARESAIDMVYIHSPDRLARRYVHQVLLMEELERFGCDVIFLEHTPSKDPNSQLLTQIQGAIAEYERAQIAERSRRGKLYHSRQGAVVSWKAPYGYSYVRYEGERGRWEINEDEAPMVRELFGWVRDEAISVRQATKRLTASPFKPRGGREVWTVSSVREILTNEAYYGVSYYNRRRWIESDRTDRAFKKNRKTKCEWRPREEWIPIPVPAIIDKDTFDRVQEQLKKNKAFSRRNLQRNDEYLVRCLLSCGVCGRSLVVHSHGRHTYYQCMGNVDPVAAGRAERCPSPQVYAPDLDTVVWETIESLLRSPELMAHAWRRQQKHGGLMAPDIIEAELQRLHDQTVDAERQIRRLVDGYQKGVLRSAELSKRRAHLEEKIARWDEHRHQLETERPKWKEWKTVSENLSRFCDHVVAGLSKLNFEEKQKLLRKIVDRIVITAGQVTIKLAIPLSTNLDLTSLGVHPAQNAATLFSLPSRTSWSALPSGLRNRKRAYDGRGRRHRHKTFQLLKNHGLLSDERLELLMSWRHTGFSADNSVNVYPSDAQGLERLARYMIRSPVSLKRLHYLPQTKQVFYQANKGHDQDDSEIVDSMEFVARVLMHVPDLNKPYIHYYGIYSNRSQHKPRKNPASAEATQNEDPPRVSNSKLRRRWANLIRRVYQTEPLICPKCGSKMRVIAFITQPRVIKKILEHCVPRMHTSTLERRKRKQCCIEDEGRPLGIGLQGQVPNRPKLLWSKARVVCVEGKGAGESVRYGSGRRTQVNH